VIAPASVVAVPVGLVGLVVGSFLNVLVYRVPRGESLVSPGSHCPRCATAIKRRHNVPVLGWLVLRGRCHTCAERISVRYPLVEAGTGALFVATTLRFGVTPQLPAYLFFGAVGLALTLIDVDVRRLPDTVVLPSYVIGVLLLLPAGADRADVRVASRALAGMVVMLVLFFALAIAYPNGVGFGGVRFAGLIGLFLGWLSWSAVFFAAVGSFVVAAAVGATAFASRAVTKQSMRESAVPLAPCLAGAAVLALFLAAPLSSWYASLLAI
jgi:leader peptidase (prepilin peptidase)/N-methyltransferase